MRTDATATTESPTPQARTWAAHLGALEAAVADARAAVQDAAPDAVVVLDERAFGTTAPVGPLQAADAERITSVLRDLHDLVDALEAARSRTARELQLHRRLAAGRPQGSGAVYVDGRC